MTNLVPQRGRNLVSAQVAYSQATCFKVAKKNKIAIQSNVPLFHMICFHELCSYLGQCIIIFITDNIELWSIKF